MIGYCPDWVTQVLSTNEGAPLVVNGNCLHKFSETYSGPMVWDAGLQKMVVGDTGFADPFACASDEDQPAGMLAVGVAPTCYQPGDSRNRDIVFAHPVPSAEGVPIAAVMQCGSSLNDAQEMKYVLLVPGSQPACPPTGYRHVKEKYVPRSSTNPCGPTIEHYYEDQRTFDPDQLSAVSQIVYDPTTDPALETFKLLAVAKSTCPGGGWIERSVDMKAFYNWIRGIVSTNPTDPGTGPNIPDQYFVFQNTGNRDDNTGSLQLLTIPTGGTKIDGWLWGAGGRGDGANSPPFDPQARGGIGGFTSFTDFAVTAGQQFAIIAGGTLKDNVIQTPVFGFGGKNSADGHSSNGGGLSGIFTGPGAVVPTDATRAIAIAGGGGGGGATGDTTGRVKGGNGNAPTAGGMADFQGANGTGGITTGKGGGGGGYIGGKGFTLYGAGGTGYLKAGLTGQIQYANVDDTVPPGTTIARYTDNAGQPDANGLVIIRVRFTI